MQLNTQNNNENIRNLIDTSISGNIGKITTSLSDQNFSNNGSIENRFIEISNNLDTIFKSISESNDIQIINERKENLKSLTDSVKQKVDNYKKEHAGFGGSIYLFFMRCLYGDIDQISNEIISKIEGMENRISNPPLNTASNLDAGSLRHLFDYLSLSENKNLNIALGKGAPKEYLVNSFVEKAQKYGYVGSSSQEAKAHLDSLHKTLSFLVDKKVLKPIYQLETEEIDLDKMIEDLSKKSTDEMIWFFNPNLFREVSNIKLPYIKGEKYENENLNALAQCLLKVKQTDPISEDSKKLLNRIIRRAVYQGDLQFTQLMLQFGANSHDILNSKSINEGNLQIGILPSEVTSEPLLHMAVRNGNVELIELLLQNGAKPDLRCAKKTDKNKSTALELAIELGHVTVAKALLNLGADPKLLNTRNKKTPLHCAVAKSNQAMIRVLLDFGVDINIKNNEGWSPLYTAIRHGNLEDVKFLVELGADVNNLSILNSSLVSAAAWRGHKKILEFLLDQGANVNIVTTLDGSALYAACHHGQFDIAKLLIAKGADINLGGPGGIPTIAGISNNDIEKPLSKKLISVEAVKFLVAQGADVNAADAHGNTALFYALQEGNYNRARFLLSLGANINQRNADGQTVLDYFEEHNEIVKVLWLRHHGANDNLAPLQLAINQKNVVEARRLLEAGESPISFRSKARIKALHLAVDLGDHEMIKLLLEDQFKEKVNVNVTNSEQQTPLHYAVYRGDLDAVKLLVDAGANIDASTSDNETPLIMAARCGKKDVVEYLLGKNAKIDTISHKYGSAIFQACHHGHLDIAEMIIEKLPSAEKTKINFCGPKGSSILASSYQGKTLSDETVHFLISNGVKVNATDGAGLTALTYALKEGNYSQAKLLLKLGANINHRNANNQTLYGYYKSKKMFTQVSWLNHHGAQ